MATRELTLLSLVLFIACSEETPKPASEIVLQQPGDTAALQDSTGRHEPSLALITADGWGPLRIGMTRTQVVEAAGEDAQPEAVGGPDPESCDQFRPRDAPEGVLVMIEKGILTRISVSRNRDIATPEGIHVGDRTSTVLAKYGTRASVEPHKYSEPPARYITVWRPARSKTDQRGIRYEIDANDEVNRINAGGQSIEYVEGCL